MFKIDGYLKIKTKIDNKGIDKGISELENKIKKLELNNSNSEKEIEILEKENTKYEELCQKADKYRNEINTIKRTMSELESKGIPATQFSNYQEMGAQLTSLEKEYQNATKEVDRQEAKLDKVSLRLSKIKQKQQENNSKITEYKQKIEQINLGKIQNSLNSVGKNIQSQIGKIGKLAMAVVEIRTAWYAVRGAVSSVKEYNSQVSADFEYMRYCIANTLLPAVQWLVKLLYTVLSYINAIASAWFGINLFGNSSVKAFQKMQKSSAGTAKSAKEIQKSLQGFDEMNVLQDNKDSSGGGISTPTTDLSKIQGQVPEWLKWIIDNKDLILSVLGGMISATLALKLGLSGIKALGIGIMVTGIIGLIQSLIKYLNDASWENFGKIISNIGLIITGVGIIIASVLGIVTGIPIIIAGVIAVIIGLIVSNWEKIKETLSIAIDWMTSKTDWVREHFGIVGEAIWKGIITLISNAKDFLNGLFIFVKNIFDGILKVFKGIFTGDMRLVLEGFKQIFKSVFDALWGIAKIPLNLIIKGINSLIRGANKIHFDVPDWVPGFGGKTFGFNIQQIPLLAKGGVISQPTQAIIGEAGKEAVVPLENNTEWLDMLADKLVSRMGGNSSPFIINMDSRTIQRGIAKRQHEIAFATNGR